MFVVPLAVAAASAHSVTSAFGYVLGEVPSNVARCEKNEYPADKAEMFVCPGDRFFKRIYIDTHRKRAEFLTGSRSYAISDSEAALRSCTQDLESIKRAIDAKYPKLLPAWTAKKHAFRLSEIVVEQHATGRRIEGWCAEPTSDNPSVVLWLSYGLGNDEISNLIDLDEADELKSKGLDPDKL